MSSLITSHPFHVYDTTLRDGAQQEGMNLSVADKLAIAPLLDDLGVGFIEGGWPGAIPKDTEFFARASTELVLTHAVLAAFGATRKPEVHAGSDPQVRALLDAGAPVVTLVAKSDLRHVARALRTTGEENMEREFLPIESGQREGGVLVDRRPGEAFGGGEVRHRSRRAAGSVPGDAYAETDHRRGSAWMRQDSAGPGGCDRGQHHG